MPVNGVLVLPPGSLQMISLDRVYDFNDFVLELIEAVDVADLLSIHDESFSCFYDDNSRGRPNHVANAAIDQLIDNDHFYEEAICGPAIFFGPMSSTGVTDLPEDVKTLLETLQNAYYERALRHGANSGDCFDVVKHD